MQKDFQMSTTDTELRFQEVAFLERIEETDTKEFWLHKKDRLEESWVSLPTMGAEIDRQRPIYIYRYNGDENLSENTEINKTVTSLFQDEIDRRVESGENIIPSRVEIQKSLFDGLFVRNIKAKYDSLPQGSVFVPDHFLVEGGYNPEQLFNLLSAFHFMVTGSYGEYFSARYPISYLLTENGYKRIGGFGWKEHPRKLQIHLNTGNWSDRYVVSRLGIEKD
jgi:hypothetical protein